MENDVGLHNVSKHYDENYFAWQKKIGNFGGKAETFKFKKTVKSDSTVLDFGCGGGYLLSNLDCKRKIGLEVNKAAYPEIIENGVEPFSSASEIFNKYGSGSIDLIISNHALEHTLNPLDELRSLYPLLKQNGVIHFVVPCDNIYKKFEKNDINFHLYSWSPSNLGNLFTEAGFEVQLVRPYSHKWPPKFFELQKIFGWTVFNLICRAYAKIERSWGQVEIIAIKK